MKPFHLITSLLIAHKSLGAEWNGCYDVAKSNSDAKLKKNKSTQVCFATGPGGDWGTGLPYRRYSFQPVADQYSQFTVPGCEFVFFCCTLKKVIILTTLTYLFCVVRPL
jgi:hypothetical protein